MRRRATDTPRLNDSGLHWDVAFRWTGTTSKAQLFKFLLWVLGASGVSAVVGSQL